MKSFDQSFSIDSDEIFVDRYRELFSLGQEQFLVRGSGLSYSPVSIGMPGLTYSMRNFNRILKYEESTGWVLVEAGVTLLQIYEFLLSRGRYLKVQPGYPKISVGGCVACNIFGKNQSKEGLFEECVESFTLFHPDKGLIQVSRVTNSKLFELTLGGFGLTGIIVSVLLRTEKKPGNSVVAENIPVCSLIDTYTKMLELRKSYDLLYSWNDLSMGQVGSGFVVTGRFSDRVVSENLEFDEISSERANFPALLTFPLGVSALNRAYRYFHLRVKRKSVLSLFDFNFPVARKTSYFRLFGKRGFIEKQILVSPGFVNAFLVDLVNLIGTLRPTISLCSCKLFSGRSKYLNFSGDGFVVSLDVPNVPKNKEFLKALDALTISHRALVNICKDSSISADLVQRTYDEYQRFKEDLSEWDPRRCFQSVVSRELNL